MSQHRSAGQDREDSGCHWLGKQNESDSIFTNLEYKGMGKLRDRAIRSDHVTYWQMSMGIMTFFSKQNRES